MELIGYKELAADDEEKDDAREYVAEGLVQAEVGGYLAGAAVEEHQQEAGEHHEDRAELGQPGHHDGGEAAAVRERGRTAHRR